MKKIFFKFFNLSLCLLVISCGKGKHMPEGQTGNAPAAPTPASPVEAQTPSSNNGPTYDHDIYPIFNKNCTACHKPGSGLPVWTNYSEAYAKRDRIMERDVVTRTMPPQGAPSLQESDISLIKKWIESGAPEGKTPEVATRSVKEPTEEPDEDDDTSGSEKPVIKEALPTIYCQETTDYPRGRIKTNNILVATLSQNLITSLASTNLSFDTLERLGAVESNTYLRNVGLSIEVCGVVINDNRKCTITNTISNKLDAILEITCNYEMPVHLKFELQDGIANVSCKTPNIEISSQYKRCALKK